MFQVYANGQLLYRPGDSSGKRSILNPKVNLKLGKAGAFSFTVPIGNAQYSALRQLKTPITVKWDDREIFRGRVLTNARGFNTLRKVYCEGDLAYLIDSVQKGRKYDGKTHDLFRDIVARHNRMVEPEKQFQVGTIGIENRDIHIAGKNDDDDSLDTTDFDYRQIAINSIADEWQTSFNHIETCLINYCGGYLRSRRVGDATYLDLIPDSGTDAAQTIQFGSNLLDLTDEVDVEDLFTVLIPLGDDNLTIESVNGGSPEIVDAEAVATYGRIVKTHVFDGVSEASTLLENGNRYMQNNQNARYTIKVRAIDMHLVNPGIPAIEVGDRVMIRSGPHGIQIRLVCTEIEYDLENPGNTIYIFGNPKQTLTDRYRKDKVKKSYGGGGGAAGPAEQARVDSQEALSEFYNAWINVDPEAGHIDLGTLYRYYNELGEKVTENTTSIQMESNALGARIDLNAKSIGGLTTQVNINTQSIKTLDDVTTQNAASIKTLSEDTKAQIELNAASIKKVEDLESAHYAQFILKADEFGSSITALAEQIDLRAKKGDVEAALNLKADNETVSDINGRVTTVETATANLSTRVTNAEAGLTLKADNETVSDINGRLSTVETATAKLSTRVGDAEASLTLKASQDSVNGLSQSVATLEADVVNLKGRVDVTGAMYVNGGVLNLDVPLYAIGQDIHCDWIRTNKIYIGLDLYSPTEITSTTGAVMALGRT